MEISTPRFQKYILVCENERETGACCNPLGILIREQLKKTVKERGLAGRVRVSRSGCLDVCAEGPNVLLMPDNIWFKRVALTDVEAIVAKAAGNAGGKEA